MLKKIVMVACSLGAASLFAMGCSSSPSGSDAGPTGDSGPADSGSGKDSGPKPDSGPGPAQCPTPADVSSFSPTAPTPPRPAAKSCQAGDYMAYYTACLDANATSTTCQTWNTANTTCGKCIASQDTDTQWGALVSYSGIVKVNLAGCYTLEGETALAKAYSELDQCRDAACGQQCPVTDNASFAQYQQCVKTAGTGGCKKYSDALNTASNAADAGAAKCNSGTDFQSSFLAVGPIFCGP